MMPEVSREAMAQVERKILAETVPRAGETGDDPYTPDVMFVVLSDGSTFPTNVRRVIRRARSMGLDVSPKDPRR